MNDDERVIDRVRRLTEQLGRPPTLQEVFYRDFTGTGKWRVRELGVPPKGQPRGRKPATSEDRRARGARRSS